MAKRDWHIIPLYGVAIQEAKASGDVEAMETVAQRAEREGGNDPEIQKGLAELRAEIAKQRGGSGGRWGGGTTLYAVAIQQARASGDVQQMRDVAQRAEREGANDPEIQSALRDLRAELDRSGG